MIINGSHGNIKDTKGLIIIVYKLVQVTEHTCRQSISRKIVFITGCMNTQIIMAIKISIVAQTQRHVVTCIILILLNKNKVRQSDKKISESTNFTRVFKYNFFPYLFYKINSFLIVMLLLFESTFNIKITDLQ